MSKPAANPQDEADGELPKEPPNLIIGLDTRNQWVVIETHGLCGGIFISQAAALRYARQESRGHPDSVHFGHILWSLTYQLLNMPKAGEDMLP